MLKGKGLVLVVYFISCIPVRTSDLGLCLAIATAVGSLIGFEALPLNGTKTVCRMKSVRSHHTSFPFKLSHKAESRVIATHTISHVFPTD